MRLLRVATQSAATDPRTGRIDMDLINTGRSASSRIRTQQLVQVSLSLSISLSLSLSLSLAPVRYLASVPSVLVQVTLNPKP